MHCLKLRLTCMHALLQTQTDFHCAGFGYRPSDHTCHLYADASNCADSGSANDGLNWYTCRPKPCQTQASLPPSLVGYWPLDGSGADISGHGLAAVDTNGEYTAGLYGQAFRFSGDDLLTVPDSIFDSRPARLPRSAMDLGVIVVVVMLC